MPLPRRDQLAPRFVDRIRHLARPSWTRSVIVRRVASVVLVVTAVGVGMTGQADETDRAVVVAARELHPGVRLSAADVSVSRVPGALVPDGALRLSADGLGRTVVSHVRPGEILTDARVLSTRLPRQLTGRPTARLVPVRPADASVGSILREGDVVDVLSPDSVVLARGAIVALTAGVPPTSGPLSGAGSASAPILLAMDEQAAHRVAAVGLDSALALVLH
ncbi:flagellar biosynthesis protein FlgA [Gordonia amarae]|uniref:SAF domain-containing protein n=2 Tax=Gordonia amarae TaxID=36821 RepID=G7GPB4_9ACTN|nr:SAF domain-containing protein [Gordonia amarae]MCS3877975.1 Flp pilus assembly protein CpaB [Gordonia amarae]QHN16679.1 flagellar biosynthesis protein FlgA [Gordonia amarae]QHN21204.1 flagellar biosynthesis protein FlgA [Gordonia amarae]QHN30058.1 flagellar biosynthesis protein FlgA [Gordonia amarae]QHN38831.1 flagellar biosynthesis protein FlgA [Gordonia amarae]